MVATNNAIYNTVGASISGVTNTLTVTNPSNTASSAARETIIVGGGSAGDPSLNFNVSGITNWEMGIDNSDSDKFKLAQGTALGTNDTFIMTTAGQRTMPKQCSFFGLLEGSDLNATGDGTAYNLGSSGTALTIIFDQSGSLNTNGTFTAPVTGLYWLYVQWKFGNISASHNYMGGNIITTTRTFPGFQQNPAATRTLTVFPNLINASMGCFANMTVGDTAKVQCGVFSGTKTVTIGGDANGNTFFCGYLVC